MTDSRVGSSLNDEIVAKSIRVEHDGGWFADVSHEDCYFVGMGGDDYIRSSAGNDHLQGGEGDDVLIGNPGTYGAFPRAHKVFTSTYDSGRDQIYGGAGDDTIGGISGYFDGGEGTDTVKVFTDRSIEGGNNDYVIDLAVGYLRRTSLGFDDRAILVGIENATGGNGSDKLYGSSGANVLAGGAGRDELWGADGNDRLYGTDVGGGGWGGYPSGPDMFLGDYLNGGRGDDAAVGSQLKDTIAGGDGNDILYGELPVSGPGGNDDQISGDAGNDVLFGQNGNDALSGGAGDDGLSGGNGDDSCYGGTGKDLVFGDAGGDFINGDEDADQLHGGTGNDLLLGGDGDDQLLGGNDADQQFGGWGWDQLLGGDGDDVLRGEGGDDKLEGENGADYLNGGLGDDILRGDSASGIGFADRFAFLPGTNGSQAGGRDVILDFQRGVDKLVLETFATFDSNRDGKVGEGDNGVRITTYTTGGDAPHEAEALLISYGDGEVVLVGVTRLDSADFL